MLDAASSPGTLAAAQHSPAAGDLRRYCELHGPIHELARVAGLSRRELQRLLGRQARPSVMGRLKLEVATCGAVRANRWLTAEELAELDQVALRVEARVASEAAIREAQIAALEEEAVQ